MIDNVFSPSFGNRPSQLVGRDAVVQQLTDGILARPGSKARATLLIGQRGMGKTVLLWELADRAREMGFVVATPTVASDGMLERVIEKLQDDGERFVSDRKNHLVGGSVGILGFTAGLQFTRDEQASKTPEYRLTRLCRSLTGQGVPVLILIDEAQADTPELRRLVIVYQELVGEGLDVAMVLAGIPTALAATLNDHVLTFFNRARRMDLEPLALTDIDAYYASVFKRIGIKIEPVLRREAAEKTQGSPYLLQLIGHNLVIYGAGSSVVDQAVLEDAVSAALHDYGDDICRTTLANLSDRDVDFLRAMTRDEGPSKMIDIAARMGVASDYAQKYRKRLIKAGVITSPQRGRVVISVPYLANYLRSS